MNAVPVEVMKLNAGASNASRCSPQPSHVHVFGRSAEGWRVCQPLPVLVRRNEAGWVMSDDIFNVFGEGGSWDEAERDYVASLVDYYLLMAEGAGEATRDVVNHLRVYLEPAR